ncbi:hypothetical protein SAMN05444955_106157 [Lihuaxuella thermophila]|uniref:Uncharacterized protein n=1 Tax=Lihuaxuella thermophila TaxID=1173111 RepID=A0A1H8E6H0_9BACL|nr:hypothetical protein SAMN05444955_106157 [Lihuaxuella thermophila]
MRLSKTGTKKDTVVCFNPLNEVHSFETRLMKMKNKNQSRFNPLNEVHSFETLWDATLDLRTRPAVSILLMRCIRLRLFGI